MAEIRVRNVDDEVISALKDRATRHGNSLSEEIRDVLTAEAQRPKLEMLVRLQSLRDNIREQSGMLPDSTPSIRAERDKRG